MISQQHVFHQQQFPQEQPWLQQQNHSHHAQNHHGMHQNSHGQPVTHGSHYNRMTGGNNSNNGHLMAMDSNGGLGTAEGNFLEENRRVLNWVAELLHGSSRETALMELSKKREQVPELALIIWHSFGKGRCAPEMNSGDADT